MKAIKILYLVSIIIFSSCSNKNNYFSERHRLINSFDEQKQLHGELLINDEIGIHGIIAADEYLILSLSGRDNLFKAYNLDGDSIVSFGKKGRADNELLNKVYSGQHQCNGNDTGIWINDVSKARMVLLNVNKSISNGYLVLDDIQNTNPFVLASFYINDSLIVYEHQTKTNFDIVKYNPQDMSRDEEVLYSTEVNDPFTYYRSFWGISPNKKRLASAMHAINLINILSLEDNSRLSLEIFKPVPDLENIVDQEEEVEYHNYYCDIKVTDSRIYALYMDQPFEDAFKTHKPQKIHVFTWDGDPLYELSVNEYITDMSIDESRGYLYGVVYDDQVYRYDISDILK